MNKRITLIFILSLFYFGVSAQKGIIKGNLTEEVNGEEMGLPFANVFLAGTVTGTTTDFDGNFQFFADAGTYELTCSFMGYETYTQQIVVNEGDELNIQVKMKPEGVAIEGVEVIAKMNRENEVALIMEQKKAAIAIETIGAKSLSAQGVGDAAAGVTKVTGITTQEGTGTLNVRGLGDRYNTTTLNKLPLPSNNPEVKNIDLKLFTTDVISHITIEKTYSSPLYGDFGGANIDIASKRLSGDPFLTLGAKVSQNSTVFGQDGFNRVAGPNSSGFYNSSLPNVDAIRTGEAYGFDNSWDPVAGKIIPNLGFDISGGKSFKAGENDLNVFFTLAHDNERRFTERIERVISATGVPLTDMTGEDYSFSTQSTGMLNLNYSSKKSEYYFNSLMLNSSNESLISLEGNIRDVGENAFRQRSDFERNMVLVNQLLGSHDFKRDISLDWGLGYNYVWNVVPDRRQNQYISYDMGTNLGEFDTEPAGANFRYFHDFVDNELAANVLVSKMFQTDADGNYKHKLSLGYSGKYRNRQFNNYQFNHDIGSGVVVDVDNVDSFINETNYLNGEFDVILVEPRDENGESIDGEEYYGAVQTNSGFGLWEWNISDKWLLLLGLRAEHVAQDITTRANQIVGIGTNVETFEFSEFKLLPSLSLKYTINDKQNLRFAASQTYTLPQLQEMPFMSFTGISEEIYGNPYLYPSDVYNADLKWEFFPKGGLLSAAVFGKYITNPINRAVLAGTLNSYFVGNTGDWAYVYGFELDAKKDLYKVGAKKLYASGNLSLMDSKMELDSEKVREETDYYFNGNFNDTVSKMQGAAPVLANLSLGYSHGWAEKNSVSAMVVYNYTSDKLFAIGQSSRGSEYEQAFNSLDFVAKSKFGALGIDFKARNILNSNYTIVQENLVQEQASHITRQYKRGVNYSFTIKYTF